MTFNPRKAGALCDSCPLRGGVPVPGEIHEKAKMWVIGEGPGGEEMATGRPFVGESGCLLERVGQFEGFTRSDLSITNVLCCWLHENQPKKEVAKALECCRPRLVRELSRCNANLALALGGVALQGLTSKSGIFNWQGGPLEALECFTGITTVIPALHPAHVLRDDGRQWMPVFMKFVQRAWVLAVGKLEPFNWPDYFLLPDKDMVDALKEIAESGLSVASDTETYGEDPMCAPITCMSLATTNLGVSTPWHPYFTKKTGEVPGLKDCKYGKQIEALFRKILQDPKIKKTYHNAGYDITALRYTKSPFENKNIVVRGYDFDTLLAHQVVSPPLKHDLGTCTAIYTHAERYKSVYKGLKAGASEKGAARFHSVDPIDFRTYNCKDSLATALIRGPLQEELEETFRGGEQFQDSMRRASIAAEMMIRGVPVDTSKFKDHIHKLKSLRQLPLRDLRHLWFTLMIKDKKLEAKARAHMAVGRKLFKTTRIQPYKYASSKLGLRVFNPRSGLQIRQLFADLLAAPVYKRSLKTGKSSYDDKVLTQLVGYPEPMVSYAAGLILRYRTWDKLQGFLEHKNINGVPIHDGVAHTAWQTFGTRTGRWSSPLMIIPKPSILVIGKRKIKTPGLRDIFTGFDDNYIVEADYCQLEAIILALMAGDERWIDSNNKGGDVHTDTAWILFGEKTYKEADSKQQKKMRQVSKTFNYAILKGAGEDTLWANLQQVLPGIQIADVQRMMKQVMKEHRPITYHLQKRLADAYKNDYIEAPLSGRRFYFYGKVKATEVKATPEQMFGADLINRAIGPVRTELDWPNEGILFQLHDALYLDGPDPSRLAAITKKHMEQEVTINGHTTTFRVDLKVGKDCGNMMDFNKWKEQQK